MHEPSPSRGRDAAAGQGSASEASKVEPTREQLDLLAGLPPAPAEDSLEAAIARARAVVEAARARRCCRRCGADEGLMFVHRRRHALNREVGKLVLWGVSTVRIREEIARCDVYCRRCWLAGTWNPTPHMLRAAPRVSVDLVAKGAITTSRGRKAPVRVASERIRKRA